MSTMEEPTPSMKVMLELEEQAQAQACTEMSRSRIVDDAKEGQRSFAFWPKVCMKQKPRAPTQLWKH